MSGVDVFLAEETIRQLREQNEVLTEANNALTLASYKDFTRLQQLQVKIVALENTIKYLRKYHRYVPRAEREALKGGEQDGQACGIIRVGGVDEGSRMAADGSGTG